MSVLLLVPMCAGYFLYMYMYGLRRLRGAGPATSSSRSGERPSRSRGSMRLGADVACRRRAARAAAVVVAERRRRVGASHTRRAAHGVVREARRSGVCGQYVHGSVLVCDVRRRMKMVQEMCSL